MTETRFRQALLLLLVAAISAAFVAMIRAFPSDDRVGSTSAFLFAALSATTRATAVFIFHFFVLLYTMFFFPTGGPGLLRAVLAYLPLTEADKQRMLQKSVSVTAPR
jgi:hypothetical protein